MRYLPTLELQQQVNQVAFPDFHAIELAQSCLTLSGEAQIRGFQNLLLSSPMLLFWISERWRQDITELRVPISAEDWVTLLVERLQNESHNLIQDHFVALSSIERIEAESFVNIQAFFECRDESGDNLTRKIVNRLILLDHICQKNIVSENRRSLRQLVNIELDVERVLSDFEQSDFSQYAGLQDIRDQWNLELKVFRDGLGDLSQKMARLEELESEFNDLVERAKISAMQQLAYGASHEVNNPLANISTRAQALLRDEQDPKRRQRLMTIDAQAFRAHDMISNLMTFAKPRRPEMQRFQLRPAIELAIQAFARLAEENQIEIKVECESSVYLEADVEQVKEIVSALVENAMDSIRTEGLIKVCCQLPAADQPVRLQVMDTGPGISPEAREHIFDPFFSGREAGRGLGFGLSKAWRLMELHHGSIRMTEKQGYTVFELQFPVQQDSAIPMEIEKTA